MNRSLIRVASVPSGHVYVRHLLPFAELDSVPRVTHLPDPDPNMPGRPAGAKWWPPVMLDAEWVRASTDAFDVYHVHFGFDARSPEQLEELVDALREAGKPLVFTVHDLRNPHHEDPSLHRAQLDVLIPAADTLLTLTPGAAEQIRAEWGRTASVLPHPHVIDEATMRAAAKPGGRHRHEDGRFVVGLHLKSKRANMAPRPVLEALIPVVAEIPGGVLQVNGHPDLFEPSSPNCDPEFAAWLRERDAAGDLNLVIHDYFTDDELWSYFRSLDVSVLAYTFGTHSGWLVACTDVGTRVIAPTCGFYGEQEPVHVYGYDEEGLDAASLERAVRDAYAGGPLPPVDVDARRRERQRIAEEQARTYERLLDRAAERRANGEVAG